MVALPLGLKIGFIIVKALLSRPSGPPQVSAEIRLTVSA